MLPFLCSHFSRIVLAHNQDGFWRPDLIDRFKPDLVILEVVEHGLRVSMGEGPPRRRRPPPASTTCWSASHPPCISRRHRSWPGRRRDRPNSWRRQGHRDLQSGDRQTDAGEGGEATFAGSGWISDITDWRPSPEGLLGLKGPGGMIVGPITLDKVRPDVGTFFKEPRAAQSGFVANFLIHGLAAGRYDAMLYRRAAGGWIACVGKQTFTVP